ncbi:MAG: carboxy-terminal, tail-specific proteinase [Chlamydiales bacterium]|jgi:carboxyl-terminal processing protease|nr:carboxy-terminal, tail-specific proteinase [Chlamydiales bacterium]
MWRILVLWIVFLSTALEGKPLVISKETINEKLSEILKSHASFKELSPELVQRIVNNYLEMIDPLKTYLTLAEVEPWIDPKEDMLGKILADFRRSQFPEFEKIYRLFTESIARRHALEKEIESLPLPKDVKYEEFKEIHWCANSEALKDRLLRIKALQMQASAKLDGELKEKTMQRIQKRRLTFEADSQYEQSKAHQESFILEKILKASAAALDTHTAYFTPAEARQFLISVQQRLFGIGAQLRDDLNGFTVVKIVEGGPAHQHKELKVKDRIIAVNKEPVIGLDIQDAVELIRGEKGTKVTLTVVREEGTDPELTPQTLDVTLERGEVVLKETRLSSAIEPFGQGVIAHLTLHSFYQDPESSSSEDLTLELLRIKKEHSLKGVILDLRNNSGGLLSQAVSVSGLFISKGVVVSIKDETGFVKHLRDLDGKTLWDGPLLILVNRASASAAEIVAQSLQDYGRAIVVGDDHTYGKGSFQTFTLQAARPNQINPSGEFKVTRGKYYTVSGKSPQLLGVLSDIVVPSALSQIDIGEKFAKYPLANDSIPANFDDRLEDIPYAQRERARKFYKNNVQGKIETYSKWLPLLQENSKKRIAADSNYQSFLKDIEKSQVEEPVLFGQNDLQMTEALNIMKDLIYLLSEPSF